MSSRRDKVLAFLAEQPHSSYDGSVGDLADDLHDPSPGALSATISVLVKDGVVGREPDGVGVKSTRLWLRAAGGTRRGGRQVHTPPPAVSPAEPAPVAPAVAAAERRAEFVAAVGSGVHGPDVHVCGPDCTGTPTHQVVLQRGDLTVGVLVPDGTPPEEVEAMLDQLHPDAPTEVPHCAGLGSPHPRAAMVDDGYGWVCQECGCVAPREPGGPSCTPACSKHHTFEPGCHLATAVKEVGQAMAEHMPATVEEAKAALARAASAEFGRLTADVVVELADQAGTLTLRIDTPWPLPYGEDRDLVSSLMHQVGAFYADRAERTAKAEGS